MIADSFIMTIATLVLLIPIALVAAGPALVGCAREMRERRGREFVASLEALSRPVPSEDSLAI